MLVQHLWCDNIVCVNRLNGIEVEEYKFKIVFYGLDRPNIHLIDSIEPIKCVSLNQMCNTIREEYHHTKDPIYT